MEVFLSLPPMVAVTVVIIATFGVVFGWRNFQRCPHCGWIVRRAFRGWLRCPRCGRQYRKGLRFYCV
mgnify:CR=1 FL=1